MMAQPPSRMLKPGLKSDNLCRLAMYPIRAVPPLLTTPHWLSFVINPLEISFPSSKSFANSPPALRTGKLLYGTICPSLNEFYKGYLFSTTTKEYSPLLLPPKTLCSPINSALSHFWLREITREPTYNTP